jgi:hypothetical protein
VVSFVAETAVALSPKWLHLLPKWLSPKWPSTKVPVAKKIGHPETNAELPFGAIKNFEAIRMRRDVLAKSIATRKLSVVGGLTVVNI